MSKGKQLSVSAIKNGTVIDHIPAKNLFKVISILGLDKFDHQITFGTNLRSKKLGQKAIIKVAEKTFRGNEVNRIALVAPEARLSEIKDYEVVNKYIVKVPSEIIGIAKCVNPKCITNNEEVTTKFMVLTKGEIALKCHYCEKITDQEHMEIM